MHGRRFMPAKSLRALFIPLVLVSGVGLVAAGQFHSPSGVVDEMQAFGSGAPTALEHGDRDDGPDGDDHDEHGEHHEYGEYDEHAVGFDDCTETGLDTGSLPPLTAGDGVGSLPPLPRNPSGNTNSLPPVFDHEDDDDDDEWAGAYGVFDACDDDDDTFDDCAEPSGLDGGSLPPLVTEDQTPASAMNVPPVFEDEDDDDDDGRYSEHGAGYDDCATGGVDAGTLPPLTADDGNSAGVSSLPPLTLGDGRNAGTGSLPPRIPSDDDDDDD